MEQAYWLSRKRASAINARQARSAEARLIHLDLAGRYSVKAALAPPPREATEAERYQRLEIGARHMASFSRDAHERERHLGMANRYVRLRLAAGGGR
jgi:hypothetical protein